MKRCIALLLGCSLFAACAPAAAPVAPSNRDGCTPRYEFAGLDRTILCADHTTTVQLVGERIRAQATLFLPQDVGHIRAVVVITEGGGLGHTAFATGFWRSMCERFGCGLVRLLFDDALEAREPSNDLGRNAATGSGDVLLQLLDSLAITTGHQELADVKLLFWGFSAAGSFGVSFAAERPERTLGFIRYHSHMRELQVDTARLLATPALLVAGERDQTAGVDDAREFWRRGRAQGAPWAFALHPGAPHFSLDGWLRASDLIWHWMEALIATRAETGEASPAPPSSPWLADPRSGEVAPASTYDGDPLGASWLPDSASAEAWRRLVARAED